MKIVGAVEGRGVTAVICDRCKESIHVDEWGKTSCDYYASLSATGGFWSPHLMDGVQTEAQLCEACWLVAREALEKIGVKFQDTEYL
jgi:hypothetical protein